MNADPQAFARLLNYIADHQIAIWFDAAGLHWQAYDEDVDAEFLRLLRRFKEPLRQAYGPEILTLEEPDGESRRGRHRARERSIGVVGDPVIPSGSTAESMAGSSAVPLLHSLVVEDAIGWEPTT